MKSEDIEKICFRKIIIKISAFLLKWFLKAIIKLVSHSFSPLPTFLYTAFNYHTYFLFQIIKLLDLLAGIGTF